MGILSSFFKKKPKQIKGTIGYLGIEQWWLEVLTEGERKYILDNVKYFGIGGTSDIKHILLEQDVIASSETVLNFAMGLLTYVAKEKELIPLVEKIENLAFGVTNTTDCEEVFRKHLILGSLGDIYYKHRENPECFNRAIDYYKKQIAMSKEAKEAWIESDRRIGIKETKMPKHVGYERMAIILEKEKKYEEAYNISREAVAEGWKGEWEKRIEKLEKKMA